MRRRVQITSENLRPQRFISLVSLGVGFSEVAGGKPKGLVEIRSFSVNLEDRLGKHFKDS